MNFKENNYTVGCDIHDYIFTKANFLIKSVKTFMTRKFWYTFKKIFSNPSKLLVNIKKLLISKRRIGILKKLPKQGEDSESL